MTRILVWCVYAYLGLGLLGCNTDEDSDSCSDGWYDSWSDLCWENAVKKQPLFWEDAVIYCEGLNDDGSDSWRMPKIHELSSLIRECDSLNCGVKDPDCLNDTCNDGSNCDACSEMKGPGGGCYWDAELGGSCEGEVFWSSSAREGLSAVWTVDFSTGYVGFDYDSSADAFKNFVRCIRSDA
jgi:Protein of unknown function (DUF1566)